MNAISDSTGDKIKVIHVITRFDKGGSAENTFLTIRDLDKKRFDVSMICGSSQESRICEAEMSAAQENLACAKRNGVQIMHLPGLVRSVNPIRDLMAFFSLLHTFSKEKPHIVHTHTSKAGLLGRWAAFLVQVPVIIHTPHGHVFWGYFGRALTMLFIIMERMTAHITDLLIMLTMQEQEDHLRFRIAPREKFAVVHSGVDFRPFQKLSADPDEIRKSLKIPANAFVIGTTGRLTPIKGHRHLIEAVAALAPHLPDLVCVLLGDGELRQELEDLALRLRVQDRVFFAGWHPDVAPVIALFDIFVFPSLNEGMGKALVEAMALGKPVVASAVGGITNLVTDGKNGLLIPPGDTEALAKSIELLYQNNNLRQTMGEQARKRSTSYSSDLMVRKIESLYGEMASKSGA
ncbi:MAG: glycosyltransferase family 4 protein [Syntrophales bacterium]|nr:glycosyltransferase family 4 protein [Syntrophales bacterium]